MARHSAKSLLRQVSVLTSEQAEEPVSALMERLFTQLPSVYTDEETRATTVTVFLKEKSRWSSAIRRELAAGLRELRSFGLDVGPGKVIFRQLRRSDWAEAWKRHFKPLDVLGKLVIKPSWSKRRPRTGQALVVLDPGLSFGTGQHATTGFCLEQIVRCRREGARQSLLDVGTGSGILAIAAAKLGYAPVEAFDFDSESIRVSRCNALINRVEKIVRPARRDLTKLSAHTRRRFDVVCANLIYDLLIAEREKILGRLKPAGDLVLAGILRTQFRKVCAAYQASGMTLVSTQVENEWQSGRFRFSNQEKPRGQA